MMKHKCIKCDNYVEGKVIVTLPRKLTRNILQEGGTKMLGGIFTPFLGSGFIGILATGILVDALWGDKIEEMGTFVENFLFQETEYEFVCPLCGNTWRKKEISQESLKAFMESYFAAFGNKQSRNILFESFKESISDKASKEYCLDFISGMPAKLQTNIKSTYNKHKGIIPQKEVLSVAKGLLNKVRNKP